MTIPNIVSYTGKFYEGETTFGKEKGWAPFDSKISVPIGKVYLMTTSTTDHDGFSEVYTEGEIVYVSAGKANNDRKILMLNRYGSRIMISLQRQMPGITRAVGDIASIQLSMSFIVVDPYQLVKRYAGRYDQLNVEVEKAICDSMLLLFNDDVWRVSYANLLTNVTREVNQIVSPYGLQVIPTDTVLIRNSPRIVTEIVDECRLAEHMLIDIMDGGRFEPLYDPTKNSSRIVEMQRNPLHRFLNEGDITVFVQNVTLAHAVRGRAFFDMMIDKLISDEDNAPEIQHFVARYAGPATAGFVHTYNEKMQHHTDVSELSLSTDVIRTSFGR
jgi:hypothetical protein